MGYGPNDIKHELVNRSQGEIVNANGYSSNHIEGRWSVVKRWTRYRNGGKLPVYTDRCEWTKLLNEFQFRKLLHAAKGFPSKRNDSSHIMRVNFSDVLDAFAAIA